jgi:tetratricopeptide (TPR) repeat protein
LKGEFEFRLASTSLRPESFDQAASWYEQAIAHDPGFALAIARLVVCRMNRHWFVESFTEAELAEVRRLAERAFALAPDLADAHVALGIFYYYGYRQYEQALAEFQRAVQLQPNNAQALEYSGYVHRRKGQWEQCLAELNKALERDPRNADVAGNLGQTYGLLRMWKEAEPVTKHAVSLDPHDVIGMRALLLTILNGSGNIAEAQRVLETFPPDNKIVVPSISGGVPHVVGERAYTFVIARDFERALNVWSNSGNPPDQRRQLAARAAIFYLAGNLTAAQAEAEMARPLVEERLRQRPNELVALRELSWINLASNRKEEALKIARQVVDLLPPEKDTLVGTANLLGLAEIEARMNLTVEAIAILRRLLSVPAGETVSIARLKIDPVWDPIRSDPGFQELLTLKEHVGP